MKKLISSSIFCCLLLLLSESASAQGWCQDRKGIYSLGLGGSQVFHPTYKNWGYNRRYGILTAPGLFFNFSGEFKVHRFISVGFTTGTSFYFYPDVVAFGIPIGARADVHILEAANAKVADKLDVFAGMTVGGGPAFPLVSGANPFGFFMVGPHGGIRYWINPKFAVFAQAGWGATFLNGGVTF